MSSTANQREAVAFVVEELQQMACEKPGHISPECLIHGCTCDRSYTCDSEEVGHASHGRIDAMCLPCRALFLALRLEETLLEMEHNALMPGGLP